MFFKNYCLFSLLVFVVFGGCIYAEDFTYTAPNGIVVTGSESYVTMTLPTNYAITSNNANGFAFMHGNQTVFTCYYANTTINLPRLEDPEGGLDSQDMTVTTYTFPDGSKVRTYYNVTTQTLLNPNSNTELINKMTTEQYTNFINLTSGIEPIGDQPRLGWWKCFKARVRAAFWFLVGNDDKFIDAMFDIWEFC